MHTSDYLDALKAHFKVPTDYALVAVLKNNGFPGMGHGLMSGYRKQKSHFDTYSCIRVAQILGLDPLKVIADIEQERDKRPHVIEFWKQLRQTAAVIMLSICGFVFFAAPSDGYARNLASGADSLCIMSNRRWLRRFASFLRLLLSGNNKKGLFNERTLSHSWMGRISCARGFHLYARRSRAAQKPIGNLLLSARTALRRAAGIGVIAASWHSVFIAPAHADGITIGFKSIHHGPGDYYERNTGLCYETGFQYFVTGCAYIDSHQEPTAILAAGVRLTVSERIHIGGVFGLRFREELNEYGQQVIDPDPMLAAIVTLGTDRHAAQVVHVPELPDAPAVSWLQYRYGY